MQRIKFGKRSDKREIFGLKMVRYEEQWGQVSDRDEGIAHIDNMDELDYLLDNANPVGVEAMFAGEFDGESHTEIGKRLGHDRSYIGNLKAAALAKARRVAKRGEQ